METIQALTIQLGKALVQRGFLLATAESCTGGWIAEVVTAIPGSSGWFERGFVTYSNLSKQQMLGVSDATLERHGAVSEAVAREMAMGALLHSAARAAIAVSGIAGPSGGTPDKPVGTVCFAWAIEEFAEENKDPTELRQAFATRRFSGDRQSIRQQSVLFGLQGMLGMLQ
uniref:Nicotinamide-nucleotide amidase n=1 Tax=Candidatus Kentrum sp. MB TaxID=2138164 RepID=A0A450XXM1_9GAMM|nr:MAG: nicotinamide-nucleotide amidase [Candidatus Kentron sp. MB]VFK33987.1 MAG: nicotinamide-nucleotide amidase [Candidatus Kentron sp. MB]VFK76401.1 MAG: nicotinamide-nucleotide amidase [Candidatus Kentron sp. MB]